MSQVVHTAYERQASRPSDQTCSPASEHQRGSWASAPAPPSGTSPASLRWLKCTTRKRMEFSSQTAIVSRAATHHPEGKANIQFGQLHPNRPSSSHLDRPHHSSQTPTEKIWVSRQLQHTPVFFFNTYPGLLPCSFPHK